MFRKPISLRWKIALGVASIVTLCLIYTLISHRMHAFNPSDKTIPTWRQLYDEGFVKSIYEKHETRLAPSGSYVAFCTYNVPRLVQSTWLWIDASATLQRLVAGLVVSVLISVVLGMAMGCYPPVESYFLPPLSFLSRVPPPAALAVLFALFGTDFKMYVALIAVGLVPVLAQAIFRAAKADVPEELISKAYTLGASQLQCIWDVIYKHILPKVLEFTRLQIGPAMVYIILAEMLVAGDGFGYRIRLQMRVLDMRIVYVYIVYLGLAGMLIDTAFRRTTRWLCPWYEQ